MRQQLDFRMGRWEDRLADVESVDHVITDPPFGSRTHKGQRHGRKDVRCDEQDGRQLLSARGLGFTGWTAADVDAFVDSWAPRTRGWFCAMTSHDLVPAYELALRRHGRYVFAPISCVQHARNVRLAGDGPSNWADHLVVARPRTMKKWGALPGAYVGKPFDQGENMLDRKNRPGPGGKPLWLMRAIVGHYSRPGDLVCDPVAGRGTTLLASLVLGRDAIGCEMNEATHAAGLEWILSKRR
jgi:hypothetical protein